MFGIEISPDILIIAIFAQMAIIVILIFIIFSRWSRNNIIASTSTSKNTELDKKVDNKLTGLQVSLSEILTEISSATRDQKESISKLATIVSAAAAAAAADTSDAAAPDDAGTITAPSTAAEVFNSTSTGGASTPIDTLPTYERASFLTKMERFASSSSSSSATATNANADITSAISPNPSTLESELFDRSEESPTPKSEFLEMDLDHDSADDDPNKEANALDLDIKKVPEVIRASTFGPPDPPASIESSGTISHHHSLGSPDSSHYYHPQSYNHLYRRQRYGDVLFESNSQTEDAGQIIRSFNESDDKNDKEGKPSQNQNYHKIEDSDFEIQSLSSEKNSNPELDKIDKEILDALQRLGGMHDSADKNNKNEAGSNTKEKTE